MTPSWARAVVNLMVQQYLDRTRSEIDRRLHRTAAFFRDEVASSREQLEVNENKILEFEIQHAQLLPDEPGSLQTMLNETQLQLIDLDQQREGLSMRIVSLEQQIAEQPLFLDEVTTAPNPERQQLENTARRLKQDLQTKLDVLRMTDQHPEMVALREQIAKTEAQIAAQPEETVIQRQMTKNLRREQLELQLTEASTRLAALDKQHQSLRRQIDQLNSDSADLFPIRSTHRKLKRQAEHAQRQIEFWESNLRRVDMALAAESGNRGIQLAFIKPAGVLDKPVSPNLHQSLAAALVLGVLAGGLSAFMAHRSNETYSNGEQLAESLELTLLGSVSEIISCHQRRVRRFKQLVLYPINSALMAALIFFLAALLYLNLERPHLYSQLKKDPRAFLSRAAAGLPHATTSDATHPRE